MGIYKRVQFNEPVTWPNSAWHPTEIERGGQPGDPDFNIEAGDTCVRITSAIGESIEIGWDLVKGLD